MAVASAGRHRGACAFASIAIAREDEGFLEELKSAGVLRYGINLAAGEEARRSGLEITKENVSRVKRLLEMGFEINPVSLSLGERELARAGDALCGEEAFVKSVGALFSGRAQDGEKARSLEVLKALARRSPDKVAALLAAASASPGLAGGAERFFSGPDGALFGELARLGRRPGVRVQLSGRGEEDLRKARLEAKGFHVDGETLALGKGGVSRAGKALRNFSGFAELASRAMRGGEGEAREALVGLKIAARKAPESVVRNFFALAGSAEWAGDVRRFVAGEGGRELLPVLLEADARSGEMLALLGSGGDSALGQAEKVRLLFDLGLRPEPELLSAPLGCVSKAGAAMQSASAFRELVEGALSGKGGDAVPLVAALARRSPKLVGGRFVALSRDPEWSARLKDFFASERGKALESALQGEGKCFGRLKKNLAYGGSRKRVAWKGGSGGGNPAPARSAKSLRRLQGERLLEACGFEATPETLKLGREEVLAFHELFNPRARGKRRENAFPAIFALVSKAADLHVDVSPGEKAEALAKLGACARLRPGEMREGFEKMDGHWLSESFRRFAGSPEGKKVLEVAGWEAKEA
jgi:hypothetical protein